MKKDHRDFVEVKCVSCGRLRRIYPEEIHEGEPPACDICYSPMVDDRRVVLNISVNYERREVIFDLLRRVFGTKSFTLGAAWEGIQESEVLGLHPDLKFDDVKFWLEEATTIDGFVPPEVSTGSELSWDGKKLYLMMETRDSIDAWRPHLRIQRNLQKLALSTTSMR